LVAARAAEGFEAPVSFQLLLIERGVVPAQPAIEAAVGSNERAFVLDQRQLDRFWSEPLAEHIPELLRIIPGPFELLHDLGEIGAHDRRIAHWQVEMIVKRFGRTVPIVSEIEREV